MIPTSTYDRTRVIAVAIALLVGADCRASQFDIAGPPGSAYFGTDVAALPNGNIVVTDPYGVASNIGAAYLYGPSGNLISKITGASADDHLGKGGIRVLANGNFLILSP